MQTEGSDSTTSNNGIVDESAFLHEVNKLKKKTQLPDAATFERLYVWAQSNASTNGLLKICELLKRGFMYPEYYYGNQYRRSVSARGKMQVTRKASTRFDLYKKARSLYLLAEEKGEVEACFQLGCMLYNGWLMNDSGSRKTFVTEEARGVQKLESAASDGHAEAMVWLGCIHVEANRGRIDVNRAREQFQRAADRDCATGMFSLAVLNSTEPTMLFEGCKLGYLWNASGLDSGTDGFLESPIYDCFPRCFLVKPAMYAHSKQLILQAARKGHSRAMFELGVIFQYGHLGESMNLPMAYSWYTRAKRKDARCFGLKRYDIELKSIDDQDVQACLQTHSGMSFV